MAYAKLSNDVPWAERDTHSWDTYLIDVNGSFAMDRQWDKYSFATRYIGVMDSEKTINSLYRYALRYGGVKAMAKGIQYVTLFTQPEWDRFAEFCYIKS